MEPKYKIGDEVWTMQDNAPKMSYVIVVANFPHGEALYAISDIKPTDCGLPPGECSAIGLMISLKHKYLKKSTWVDKVDLRQSDALFPSKEALIQSL